MLSLSQRNRWFSWLLPCCCHWCWLVLHDEDAASFDALLMTTKIVMILDVRMLMIKYDACKAQHHSCWCESNYYEFVSSLVCPLGIALFIYPKLNLFYAFSYNSMINQWENHIESKEDFIWILIDLHGDDWCPWNPENHSSIAIQNIDWLRLLFQVVRLLCFGYTCQGVQCT